MTLIITQLLLILAVSITVCRGIPVPPPEGDDSGHLLNLSEDEAYTLLKDSIGNPEDPHGTTEELLNRLYNLGEKSDDAKRKFSAWAGKRTEVAIPWGDVLRVNGGGEMIRRAFKPWAGKRAFKPWAGKRSADDVEEEDEKRGFKPWAGKRSEAASDKRGFKPWAGKRSELYGDDATELERSEAAPLNRMVVDGLGEYVEKRGSFSPWKGKRVRPSGKRVFNPWAGK